MTLAFEHSHNIPCPRCGSIRVLRDVPVGRYNLLDYCLDCSCNFNLRIPSGSQGSIRDLKVDPDSSVHSPDALSG